MFYKYIIALVLPIVMHIHLNAASQNEQNNVDYATVTNKTRQSLLIIQNHPLFSQPIITRLLIGETIELKIVIPSMAPLVSHYKQFFISESYDHKLPEKVLNSKKGLMRMLEKNELKSSDVCELKEAHDSLDIGLCILPKHVVTFFANADKSIGCKLIGRTGVERSGHLKGFTR